MKILFIGDPHIKQDNNEEVDIELTNTIEQIQAKVYVYINIFVDVYMYMCACMWV